jgi:hypothetical protein
LNARSDMVGFFSRVVGEDLEDLALLRRAPIVSFASRMVVERD